MNRIITTTVIAFFAATAFAQSIQDGLKQMDNDNLEQARSIFAAYTKNSPTDADGFFHLGNVYSLTGKADSAKTMYAKAVEVNKGAALAQIAAGRLALAAADNKTADNMLEKASRTGRKSSDTYRYIAESYAAVKNYTKAEEWYSDALDKDNKNARIHLSRGDMYFAQNDGGKAVNSYELAAYHDKTLAAAFLKIARVQRRAKNPSERMAALEKAKAANPALPAVYRDLADAFFDRSDFPAAKINYKKYMEMAGATVDMQIRYLNVLFYNKEYKEALGSAEAILKAYPAKTDVYRALGYAYYELGDSTKSVTAMEQFLKTAKPEKIVSADYEFYGKGLSKIGKIDEAAVAFDKAVALDTTDIALPAQLAKLYNDKKNYLQAAKYYSLVIKRRPKPEVQDFVNLGFVQYVGADNAAAEMQFKKVIEMRPEMMLGYEYAANVAFQLDPTSEKGAAKGYCEKMVELGEKDAVKYAEQLKTAYSYLAGFACKAHDAAKATEFANKILATDPANEQAKAIATVGCN